jgi:GT2 family glycosyltransferase
LGNCLRSLSQLSYAPFEVILVDAQSVDGSAEYVKKNFPWVEVIEAGRIGVGAAINLGIKNARGELLVYDLNNDEVVNQNWLSVLVSALLQDDKLGVVGGTRIIHSDNGAIVESGMKLDFLFHTHRIRSTYPTAGPSPLVSVDFVNYGIFRRAMLSKTGPFDEGYYFYGEDADFCLRVKRCGYEVMDAPNAISESGGSITVGKGTFKQIYFSRRAGLRLAIKHMVLPVALLCLFERGILVLLDFASEALGPVTGMTSRFATNGSASLSAFRWNLEHIKDTLAERCTIYSLKSRTQC